MELFKLFGTIAVNNSDANKSIEDSTSKASELGSKFEFVGSKVSAFGDGIANVGKKITTGMAVVGGAVAGGATAIFKFAESTASAADTVDKMSQKIGISREAYQELDFICSQSGTSVDSLQMGMKSLTAAMDGAASGTKSNVEQFEKLGISVTDANGQLRSQEDVMWETMSALQGMENQTEKARLATELFGRSGSELMPLLNGASGSIEEMKQQAHDLGLVMSDETIDEGVKFTDTIDQLKRSLSKAGQTIGAELMPYIREFAQYVIDHLPQIRDLAGQVAEKVKQLIEKVKEIVSWYNSLDESQQKIIEKIALLVVSMGPLLIILGKVTSGVGSVISVVGKLAPMFSSAGAGASGLGAALGGIAAPVLAVVAAVGLMVAAFKHLWDTNEEFRNNILGIWEEIKSTFSEFTQGIVDELNELGFDFENITDVIKAVWDGLCKFLVPAFEIAFSAISAAFRTVTQFILGVLKIFVGIFKGDWSKVLDGVKQIVKVGLDFIKNLFTTIFNTINALTGGKLGEVVDKFKEKFEIIKEVVKLGIDTVKNFFDNLKLKLPDIKLPHFKLNGEFDLSQGKVPSIGVDWYAKGGIMQNPTAFGINGNNIMVGGEAGDEAIAPIDLLQTYVRQAVSEANASNDNSRLEELLMQVIELLGAIEKKDTSIEIDGRKFGRVVRTYA